MKITVNRVLLGVLLSAFIVLSPQAAFAHVTVTPSEVLSGSYETFTTNVPNEKDIPVTEIRLVIPNTVESITPTVKPGWEIETKKSDYAVTEIKWKGGTIDPERRDTFTFSAHIKAETGTVVWKAYQTYQDGSVVAWDQAPSEDAHHGSEDETNGPYSETVINEEEPSEASSNTSSNLSTSLALVISGIALVLSVFAFVRATKK